MKTFETENHNIPEGATHYFKETENEKFAWWNESESLLLCPDNSGQWESPGVHDDVGNPIPIPQTNIETPEEKEALDLIDTTPQQYESVASKEVEWVNGDECLHTHHDYAKNPHMTYIGQHPFIGDLHICLSHLKGVITVNSCYLARPETKQQREEREREEFKVEMCKDLGIDAVGCNTACIINKLYELGYRKEG